MESSDWPSAHSETLREYVAVGMSYSAIADAINKKFATSYTRSAALGRAKRMALDGPGRSETRRFLVPTDESPSVEIGTRTTRERRVSEFWRLPPVFKATEIKELRTADIIPRNLSLIELKPGDCR